MKTESSSVLTLPASSAPTTQSRLPLRAWSLELARRWNGGTYSLFILHGNIFDLFPVQENSSVNYVPLKTFLVRRLFPERACLLFYDISDGLTFGSPDMQKRFFEWLEIYDNVENTNFHEAGLPKDLVRLAPLLRRFFLRVAEEKEKWRGITLIIDFPEKLIPACEEASASMEERMNLVTFLKWAAAPEMARLDIGVVLVTESADELSARLLQNPYVAQVRIELPDAGDRLLFLQQGLTDLVQSRDREGAPAVPSEQSRDRPPSVALAKEGKGAPTPSTQQNTAPKSTALVSPAAASKAVPTPNLLSDYSDLSPEDLAARTSGLNLLRIRHFLAEAIRNGIRITQENLTASKKRLIEEYCQGLVRFKDPKTGISLDLVATHTAAKKRLRELAWLIKNGKTDVLERGVLVPGRVGVGKSFLIDCFASECGLPVMEMGEFRSKWVGDTERQQARILMTIRALGPVIVVVDEADAVFGSREADGDSGVSGRVFAAFAAHIGDSTLRGRELWVAMTSRPDLLSIDMKRQGRFGLCIPLFPAQSPDDVAELFTTVARGKKITLTEPILAYIRETLGPRPLTGSDVESILIRAKERAVLAKRDTDVQRADLEEAVSSFIDPLDPDLLALQELAAVLACSDKRYLPDRYANGDRASLLTDFTRLKMRAGRG